MGVCLSKDKLQQYPDQPKDSDIACSLTLDDFELQRVIGKGAFGKVKVVIHKRTHSQYALKYIDKQACVERNATANVIRERKILAMLDHALVCNLRYAFQDDDFLYLVCDLMLGGDLRFHLLRRTFTEQAVRHWVAELTVALSYCHGKGIIHRDVKPDNILLTEAGHIKLADFNISVQMKGSLLPKSRSGSLFYMAPEVHFGQSYDFAIDFWSLGITFYESIYGERPFNGKTNDEVSYNICHQVLTRRTTSPQVSEWCQAALGHFLTKDPRSRPRSIREIQGLHFFSDIDWKSVQACTSIPPFVPGGIRNFDASWELEEILLHDSPLEAKRSSRNKGKVDKLKLQESYVLLENQFTNFDHTKTRHSNNSLALDLVPKPLVPELTRNSVDLLQDGVDEQRDDRLSSEMIQVERGSQSSNGNASRLLKIFKRTERSKVVLPAGILALKPRARVTLSAV